MNGARAGGHDAGGFLERDATARILGAFHHVFDAGVVVPVAIGVYDSSGRDALRADPGGLARRR
jgi:hypothetical protein